MKRSSNKINHKPVSVKDWYEMIVNKSGVSIEETKSILSKYEIEPQSTTPIRKAIQFQNLSFSGKKTGTNNDEEFTFNWSGLTSGFYGVLSEDNLVGKSTILRLLYSVLRGDFSSVSPPVLSWINKFSADFSIGSSNLRLELVRDDDLEAKLVRIINNQPVIEFSGGIDELSDTMDQIFMKELDFQKVSATIKQETLVQHGWPAMVSALFISGADGALIGDHTTSGLPKTLLQTFIGLPWISTQTKASAVLKIQETLRKTNRSGTNQSSLISRSIEKLQLELDSLPLVELEEKRLLDDKVKLKELQTKSENMSVKKSQLASLVASKESELLILKRERLDLLRITQSLKENLNAGYVFRKLQPVCCPACESTSFDFDDFIVPAGKSACPLCKDVTDTTTTNEDQTYLTEQEGRVTLIETNIKDFETILANESDELNQTSKDLEKANSDITKLRTSLADDSTIEDLFQERLIIDSKIEQLKQLIPDITEEESETPNELAVLKATVSETKKMYDEKEQELFDHASTTLKEISSRLGIKHLTSVDWKSGALRIVIAGTHTTFSKLSPGEKLRFRIAASITIAKLAASTGQGRHPGILFFDSPKSEEIVDSDFQEIVDSITELGKEDDDLQIYLASRVNPEYPIINKFTDAKHSTGKDFLF